MTVIYATLEGKKELEKKLAGLIEQRRDVANQIKVAREFGDLRENAEYAAAREAQNNLESEILQIEAMIPYIKLFNYSKADTSAVNLGTKVTVEVVGKKMQVDFVITGILESCIDNNYVSNESPVGAALLGKKVGDVAEVKVPAGKISYKILKISNVK